MPDVHGSLKTDAVPATTLHAYADRRLDDVDPGTGGVTGQDGTSGEGSFTGGGHPAHTEFGATPAANGRRNGPGGPSGDAEFVAPYSPARAAAGRTPRGAPPA